MEARGTLWGTMAASLVVTLGLSQGACFSPTYQEGLACSESGECPGDQSCVNGTCQLGGGSDFADADTDSPDSGPTFDATPGDPDAAVCPPGSETFDFTGAIENFTLPDCATSMHIEASGAQGGGGRGGAGGGGLGATIAGDFVVSGGETLQILVGEQGADAVVGIDFLLEQGGGTGGGGSFVLDPNGLPLVVAGGGGGASHTGIDQGGGNIMEILIPGGPGQVTEDGQAGGGPAPGAGGVGGGGGGRGSNPGFHVGTGAGGFSGNGVGASDGSGSFGTANQPGSSFQNGGSGGIGGSRGRDGGFGGGGSAGFLGGGGGGYSGGGGSDRNPNATLNAQTHGGGGGGSFNAGTNPNNQPGVRAGHGQVVLSYE